MELNDFGYLDAVVGNLERVRAEQAENIAAAASLMADAIAEDRLIHVYGGGGHTHARDGRDVLPGRRPCEHRPGYGNRAFRSSTRR